MYIYIYNIKYIHIYNIKYIYIYIYTHILLGNPGPEGANAPSRFFLPHVNGGCVSTFFCLLHKGTFPRDLAKRCRAIACAEQWR